MSKSIKEYPIYKSLFLLYITGGLLYTFVAATVFTFIVALSRLIPPLRSIAGTVFIIIMIVGVIFALIMTISILLRRELISFIPTRMIWMGYLVTASQPIAERIGMDKDKAVWAFITINNDFVLKELRTKKSGEIKNVLILLPHCLQLSSCLFKVTNNINNCRKCGKCTVMNFIDLSEKFALDVFVSTGGTMARKVIKERRPQMILAVACERDLLSGVRDTLGLPVLGLLNERPNGPCHNTTVDLSAIEDMLTKCLNI